MSARAWLYAADGRLRAPWRILVFLLAAVASFAVAQSLASPLLREGRPLGNAPLAAEFLVLALALLGAHLLVVRWMERRSWSAVWLGAAAAQPSQWLRGWIVGALAIGIPCLLLIGVRWLAVVPGAGGSWFGAAGRTSIALLPAALWEELLTRGYVLSVLRDAWGWWPAIATTSIAFGAMHLTNPGADLQSVTLVTVAGFFLGGIVWATRSLYAAWMAHFAWNWVMAVALHASVSGVPFDQPDYRTVDAGPDWATGGPWGPEGGAAAGLGMIGGLVYLSVRRRHEQRDR
ncbi:MAG TPA: CPBP family intramembrane glutamic endopeptidase [Gemmatimonadaceae bacterium]|nr:CPBP family intramembrane glutamic endopeptidase [Gemmatimonadaceae bacterium]